MTTIYIYIEYYLYAENLLIGPYRIEEVRVLFDAGVIDDKVLYRSSLQKQLVPLKYLIPFFEKNS